MSQTLYRKYRSQTFAELVGQDAVLRVLRNSIVRGRLNHAYLFCGPRGTGKTSVARIFAKALNCLDPREGDACGVCENCLSVANGSAVDVVEIDAASNRSVEDVEDLRKRVGYAPLRFKYKVYIIDEVHMISTHGFNALLKTLEEPPSHVVFCLCTTESNKLPVTILSRCIRFDFTRIALPKLAAHLQAITAQEGLSLDEDAALELAELAEGSARDAISLLDQLTVYCSERITLKDIRELFQLGDPALMERIVAAISSGDPQALIGSWDELAQAGMDASRFLLDLAGALKQRHLAEPSGRWRMALEAVWKGLNLLKYDNFPALLIELTLLEAQAALTAPLAVAAGPGASAGAQPAQQNTVQSHAPVRMPEGPSRMPAQSTASPAASASGRVSPARAALQQQPVQSSPGGPSRSAVHEEAPGPETQTTSSDPPAVQSVRGSSPGDNQQSAVRAPGQASEGPASKHGSTAAPGGVEEWERFLAALERVSLTSYALLWMDVVGRFTPTDLLLSFPPTARQQYGWVQEARHIQAIVDTASRLAGRALGLRITILGDEASAMQLASAAPDAPLRRPLPEPPGDLPDEIVYDSVPLEDAPQGPQRDDEPGPAGRSRQPDPADLSDLERMGRQVDAALPVDGGLAEPQLLSADEAASLFEGAEILEDDNAEY